MPFCFNVVLVVTVNKLVIGSTSYVIGTKNLEETVSFAQLCAFPSVGGGFPIDNN